MTQGCGSSVRTFGAASVLLLVSLVACGRPPTPAAPTPERTKALLTSEEKIVRATLKLLASDGKPVCVERETLGGPLSIWRTAPQGGFEKIYGLAWFPPRPFRPPSQPALEELGSKVREGENYKLAEPVARRDKLPAAVQTNLDAQASALAEPKVAARPVIIRQEWVPQSVMPRWWPDGSKHKGCDAQYVLSAIKSNAHAAFVSVRVDHWGTVFALAPHGDDWRPIAQWGTWVY